MKNKRMIKDGKDAGSYIFVEKPVQLKRLKEQTAHLLK